jgi:hypothetical protein
MNRKKTLAVAAVAAVALVGVTGCRIHPSSPGFNVPTGGAVWFVDTDSDGDGHLDTRGVWTFCLGSDTNPKPCGTTPQHNWTPIGGIDG